MNIASQGERHQRYTRGTPKAQRWAWEVRQTFLAIRHALRKLRDVPHDAVFSRLLTLALTKLAIFDYCLRLEHLLAYYPFFEMLEFSRIRRRQNENETELRGNYED